MDLCNGGYGNIWGVREWGQGHIWYLSKNVFSATVHIYHIIKISCINEGQKHYSDNPK